jgi:hypothetical protein
MVLVFNNLARRLVVLGCWLLLAAGRRFNGVNSSLEFGCLEIVVRSSLRRGLVNPMFDGVRSS